MKNPVGSESAASKTAERPSLYDGAVGAGRASEAFSILDALDAPAKKSGVAKWMLVLIVIALLGTALLLYSAKKTGVTSARQLELTAFTQFLSNRSEKQLPDEPKAAGWLPSTDFAMPSTTTKTDTPQPEQTAAVFSSPSMPSERQQQAAMVPEASVAQAVTKVAGAAGAVSGPAAEPIVPPPAKPAQHTPHKKAKPVASKPVRQQSTVTDRTSAKPSRAPTSRVQGKKDDRDVDLIAALLSHVGVAGSDRRELTAVPARKTNTLSREGTSGPSLKKSGAPDAGRDVVLQSVGDTIDTLVKRCQALGFFEGQLCRLRICSGHGGRDAACPVNSLDRSDS
ncbi:hypothetical protein [Noviherbaspirillum sp. Root189]|uniref:hypothetical protein n=1 Tax=Noviherbaspirillum sp. Root189 TaxID=1736487 RepID=UPI00070ED609|nr:hypothetical protein [Noviherbaspirillum sp. Root189]KRB66325.1 hypothetical protein ASE07_10620 [Noviherbaspirillum sp. Root189]